MLSKNKELKIPKELEKIMEEEADDVFKIVEDNDEDF